ncbi:MAG: cyclic nucleotide-binding domain-containing protein [Acidobacteria bacterium]|nr:cyclic nucleotide-binding domain-containing protein [Acidobacteriota bacterium]
MSVETFEKILAEHPFFEGMRAEHVATLAGCVSNVKFDQGDYLFREGQPADRFYVVRFGRVTVETFAPTRGSIAIETVDAGDVLGWSWLFPPYKWHFDARAMTLVRAFALDGVCLRGKCERDPALGYELMRRFAQVIVSRLEATQLQLLDLYVSQP